MGKSRKNMGKRYILNPFLGCIPRSKFIPTWEKAQQILKEHTHADDPIIILPTSLNDIASEYHFPKKAFFSAVDFFLPDGMPLVWWHKFRTKEKTQRLYGPTFMKKTLERYSTKEHQLAGNTAQTVELLAHTFQQRYPQLKFSPALPVPFFSLHEEIPPLDYALINTHQPQFIWISLSSPKQIVIAAEIKKNLHYPAVIICVGAAFDFLIGKKTSAPPFLQQIGFEWLYRLVQEPKRLFYRYCIFIPSGIARIIWETLKKQNT